MIDADYFDDSIVTMLERQLETACSTGL